METFSAILASQQFFSRHKTAAFNFQIDTFKLESDIPYDENNEPIEDIKVSPELFDNDEDYIPEDQGNLLRGIDKYYLRYKFVKRPWTTHFESLEY